MNYAKPLALIAGTMLLLAIPPLWPYAYFQILRIIVCGAAVLNAYLAYHHKHTAWVWIMGIVAVVFNPIAPLYLTKGLWSVLDLMVAIVMFVSYIKLARHRL